MRSSRQRRWQRAGLAVAMVLGAAAVWAAPVDFSIPAGDAAETLKHFGTQARVQMLFVSEAVERHATPAVSGELEPAEALKRLLAGTGLTFEFVNERTVAVRGKEEGEGRSTAAGVSGSDGAEDAVRLAQTGGIAGASPAGQSAEESSRAADVQQGSGGEDLEEIVVTAQKRKERAIDVPISITAMSGEKLERAGIKDIQDLSFAVPSMNVTEQAPGKQFISIRGVSSVRGIDPLNGVYVDEMPVTNRQGFAVDLPTLDLDRVEVLKGPQGTLFGAGSAGGTLRFITNDPDLHGISGKVSTRFLSTADADWGKEATGVLNLPVVAGKLGLRIAADYADEAGWIDQVAVFGGPPVREDINFSESSSVRAKALWLPTDKLTLKAMTVVHRNDFGAENVINDKPADDSNYVQGFFRTEEPIEGLMDYELYNLTGTYDLGFAEALSSTSYSDVRRLALSSQLYLLSPATPGGAPIQRDIYFAFGGDAHVFSEEIRFSSKSSGRFNWTGGVFYQDLKTTNVNRTGTYLAHDGVTILTASGQGVVDVRKSKSWAVFADGSYRLTDRLEIGGGIRDFNDDRETFNPANVAGSFLSGKFDALTFRSFISYALANEARVYASVGEGFRSGDFNLPSSIALGAPVGFDPENVISYELGTKFLLRDLRLNVEAALFFSKYEDIQGETLRGVSPPFQFTANGGEAEIKGFEWALQWAATDRLALGLSGDIIDTEVTKIDTTVATPQLFVGDPLNNVPEYSLVLTGDYSFNWNQSVPGFFRMQFYEQGKSHSTAREPFRFVPQNTAPVVDFLSASIGADWSGWSFELIGQNLLDERGAVAAGFTNQTPQARPRSIGIRVEKSF